MKSYEQKYKEALEWMQSLYSGLHGATKEDAEHYFPELKESEDERIRKWCISHFNACINVIKDNDEYKEYLSNKVIAWLEKQQPTDKIEPTPAWSEEDEEMLKWLCRIIHSQRLREEITLKEESELGEWMDKWLNHNPQAKQGEKKLTENAKTVDSDNVWLQNYISNVNCYEHHYDVNGLIPKGLAIEVTEDNNPYKK